MADQVKGRNGGGTGKGPDLNGRRSARTWPPSAVPADIPIPPVAEPRPGVWSVPIPLLGNPLRYVVVYVIETVNGLVMIDAGWGDDASWQALTAGMAEIGARVADVTGVLVTHLHPDHYGLAPRIRRESGAWVALHPADLHMMATDAAGADAMMASQQRWLKMAGAPQSAVDALFSARERIHRALISSPPDVLLKSGERVDVAGYDLIGLHITSVGYMRFTRRPASGPSPSGKSRPRRPGNGAGRGWSRSCAARRPAKRMLTLLFSSGAVWLCAASRKTGRRAGRRALARKRAVPDSPSDASNYLLS
jgi:hypothetical protein